MKKMKILIVDDQPGEIMPMIIRLREVYGVVIDYRETYDDGMKQIVGEEPYDAIILDWDLGEKDCSGLWEALKDHREGVLAILISMIVGDPGSFGTYQHGYATAKPCTAERLHDFLKIHIDKS